MEGQPARLLALFAKEMAPRGVVIVSPAFRQQHHDPNMTKIHFVYSVSH